MGKNKDTGRVEWDKYFLNMAIAASENSKCLSRKIGAVLVRDNGIVSTGYNGPPRDAPHCDSREFLAFVGVDWIAHAGTCPRRVLGFKSGAGLHLCQAGHAERNAISNAAYLGARTKGTIMYMTCGIPCKECAIHIINAGIEEIVVVDINRTYDELSVYLFNHSKVHVREYER